MTTKNELTKNEYDLLSELYLRLEPYQYLSFYLEAVQLTKEAGRMKMVGDGLRRTWNYMNCCDATFNSNYNKIIQIDKDLLGMIEDTDAHFEDLNLPYPSMFINQQFKVGQFIINGFLLIDTGIIKQFDSSFVGIGRIDILSLILHTEKKFEFYTMRPLIDDGRADDFGFFDNLQEQKDMLKASKIIRKIAANLIHVITHEKERDVEEYVIPIAPGHNEKRLKRGQAPQRDKLVIRLKGKLKEYARFYTENRGGIGVAFMVSGYYRHFRSDFYKNVKGSKKWIYPSWRGIEKNLPIDLKKFVEYKGG